MNAHLKKKKTQQQLQMRLTGVEFSTQDSGSEEEEEEALVTITAVNRVFEWSVWRHVTVLDAVKTCHEDSSSSGETGSAHVCCGICAVVHVLCICWGDIRNIKCCVVLAAFISILTWHKEEVPAV